MRLTRRDWEILERVPVERWERWLDELGYVRIGEEQDESDPRRRIAHYRRGLDTWLPLNRSMYDYRARLSLMIEDVTRHSHDVSMLRELASICEEVSR